jgi:hypothetical protein
MGFRCGQVYYYRYIHFFRPMESSSSYLVEKRTGYLKGAYLSKMYKVGCLAQSLFFLLGCHLT